ncbi:restriction endonuclease subunit S [Chryseobacterium sp. T16E-39]|uniref:restriction endonuclease subunit S n=1 Tax=Chryseobacterium sp. T16E-39 TaxID=2015076 RepID=UPI001E29053E|nr:restriction endonuclease subunit S [Chryseobacterium sp. T16E-39]
MTEENKSVKNFPNLRFPGFEGEWRKTTLESLGNIITGSTPATDETTFYNGNRLFVSPTDLQSNRYVFKTKTTLTEKGFNKGRKIRRGSTYFVCIGSTIGKVGQATEDSITNQQINSVIPVGNDDDFVFSLLEYSSLKIKSLSAEQAVPIINKTTFSNVIVAIPNIEEQEKISSLFKLLDERIQTQKKIIEQLETLIKGVGCKLFNKRIRFKNTDLSEFPCWERKKGNEVFSNISNKNHNSELPILAVTQEYGAIPRDLIDFQISVTDKSVESYKIVEKGDFIISLRSFQGGIEYSEYKGICSPAYIILRNNTEINSYFYKYYFKSESYIKQLNKN